MCGRFTLSNADLVRERHGFNIVPSYNIAPSREILTIASGLKPKLRVWGFTPSWYHGDMNLINARLESLYDKPSFKNVLRCVIPADGWFEWLRKGDSKIPFYHHGDGQLIYFAGLYNTTSGCAIVTCPSTEAVRHIHHRQPLLINREQIEEWFSDKYQWKAKNIPNVRAYAVSKEINNPKCDRPQNIVEVSF